MIRRPLAEVRMRLRLAMNFQIYGISDQYSFHDATAPDAIANSPFGRAIATISKNNHRQNLRKRVTRFRNSAATKRTNLYSNH
ncbi:hypothetical protein [Nostoc sp.]|uniref:hypothetical protein n=1 Tax=Nostoc sp. TaxID=1180 RepID=UPI002FFAB77C